MLNKNVTQEQWSNPMNQTRKVSVNNKVTEIHLLAYAG